LRAIENRAYSLRNAPARVQFQPTAVGLALRCARIAFAVAYPELKLRECFEIQTLKVFLAKRVHQLRRKPA
jgi:hypothetical protein